MHFPSLTNLHFIKNKTKSFRPYYSLFGEKIVQIDINRYYGTLFVLEVLTAGLSVSFNAIKKVL